MSDKNCRYSYLQKQQTLNKKLVKEALQALATAGNNSDGFMRERQY